MKLANFFRTALCALLITGSAYAQNAEYDAVYIAYFGPPNQVPYQYGDQAGYALQVDFTPAVANLDAYVATPSYPYAYKQVGYVDQDGLYAVVGGELITDPTKIAFITSNFELLDPEYWEYNLQTYAGTFPGGKYAEIVFVDESGLYALCNATVLDAATQFNVTFNAADENIHNDWAAFLYHTKENIYSFREGSKKAKKKLLILGEPNCPNCHFTRASFLGYMTAGELQIEWSLVPLVIPSSFPKLLAIYDAKIPRHSGYPHTVLGAWEYNENYFNITTPQPGSGADQFQPYPYVGGFIRDDIHPSKKAVKRANEAFYFLAMYDNGYWDSSSFGVPFILFRTKDGSYNYQFNSVIGNIQEFVNNLYEECE